LTLNGFLTVAPNFTGAYTLTVRSGDGSTMISFTESLPLSAGTTYSSVTSPATYPISRAFPLLMVVAGQSYSLNFAFVPAVAGSVQYTARFESYDGQFPGELY
jgi:hypothetical protein